jgi:hypothetical protein
MISFHQHLDEDHVKADAMLDTMAQEHWDNLSRKVANGTRYFTYSLPQYCEDLREELKSPTVQAELKIAPPDVPAIDDFFASLAASDYALLKKIIVCRPADFKQLRDDIVAILPEHVFYNGGQTPFNKKLLSDLFKYETFRDSPSCKNFLLDKLKIGKSKCVYCNIADTDIVNNNADAAAKPSLVDYLDLDHFLDKARNPFFALSFYNLVPCCHICNSRVKGTKSFDIDTHINPFHHSFDDLYKFVYLGTGRIDVINRGTKPDDLTAQDFNILTRTAHKLDDLEELLDWYTEYSRDGLTTEKEKRMFVRHFKPFVPMKRRDMLKFSRGKLYRDVLMKVDEDNGLLGF